MSWRRAWPACASGGRAAPSWSATFPTSRSPPRCGTRSPGPSCPGSTGRRCARSSPNSRPPRRPPKPPRPRCQVGGAAAYRVLLPAAALAQPFDPEPLAALLHADPAELTEELERLCERRILRVDGPRFRFRYDLVREVLLASLSPARRRLLRQQLGHPADQAGSIAATPSPGPVKG